MKQTRLYIGVFLVTLSVLMLELGLTRLFSATMFYHFAFLAVSLALFGSAASGLFIYFIERRLAHGLTGSWLGLFSVLFGFTTLQALDVILSNPLTLDFGSSDLYRLLAIYLASALPFFFAGCTVTLAITRQAQDVSRLYFADLAGAATGCLLLIPVINAVGAINALLLVGVLAAVAAVVLSTGGGGSRAVTGTTALAAAGLLAILFFNCHTQALDVRVSKGRRETGIVFSKWNSFSRVTVSEDDPGGPMIRIDADAATAIAQGPFDRSLAARGPANDRTLVYRLKTKPDVLIIGPGGGRDVVSAIENGARSVTAVEINPIIARDVMSSEPFKSYSGNLFEQPEVTLRVDEGRSFIRSSARRYDVIQATLVDTWAATAAGAFALTENNLYTVEAFEDYARHLTDDGLLAMTRWYFEPPDQMLRMVAITLVMMRELGISRPERHIIVTAAADHSLVSQTLATLIFKKSELTDSESRAAYAAADAGGLEVLYSPTNRPDNAFTRMIEAQDPAVVWNALPNDVSPVRDNSPFFFNSLRVSKVRQVFSGGWEWQKTNLGTFVLWQLLWITAALVLALLFGPLLLTYRRRHASGERGSIRFLAYFGCLGAGFIIIEVALVQKFILFLGHPVYALTVVLFSLLLFSAFGSFLTSRFGAERLRRSLLRVLGGLAALVLVYVALLPPVFYGLVHLPLPLRIGLAVVLLAPLAVMMGMPMPIGIKLLTQSAPALIPWAWGVNGATSVMGSVAALVIAILSGFSQALVMGAALYLLAAVLIMRPRLS